MSSIIILLLLIFVGYPICKCIASWDIDRQYVKKEADKELMKIVNCAKEISDDIETSLDVDGNMVLYEELFFLYFFHVVKTIDSRNNEKICDRVKDLLFTSLENTKNLGFQDNKNLILNVFNLRCEHYNYILKTHNLKIDNSVYEEIINYQTELVACIKYNHLFSNFCPEMTIYNLDKYNVIRKHLASYIEVYKRFYNAF